MRRDMLALFVVLATLDACADEKVLREGSIVELEGRLSIGEGEIERAYGMRKIYYFSFTPETPINAESIYAKGEIEKGIREIQLKGVPIVTCGGKKYCGIRTTSKTMTALIGRRVRVRGRLDFATVWADVTHIGLASAEIEYCPAKGEKIDCAPPLFKSKKKVATKVLNAAPTTSVPK